MIHIHKKIVIITSLSSLWFTAIVAMDESKKTIDLSWLPGNLQNNAATPAASVPVIPFVMPTPQHDMSPEEKFNHALLTILTLTKRVDEQEKTIAEQSQQLQDQQQESAQLNAALLQKNAALEARVIQGDKITAEQSKMIAEQSQQLQARQQEIDGLKAQSTSLQARVSQYNQRMARQSKTIAEQSEQLQAQQHEITCLACSINAKIYRT